MKQVQTCIIFAAGDYYENTQYAIAPKSIVLAADGGYEHACSLGVHVDYLVGDFDSTNAQKTGSNLDNTDIRTVILPAEKDDPDLLCALKFGWSLGAREFHIYGGLGGRIDHSISAMQLMALLAAHGATGYLHGDDMVVTAICNGSLTIGSTHGRGGSMFSVFAHSNQAFGVNERGLKYTLVDATMSNLQVNGVSNELIADQAAQVWVDSGIITVVYPEGIATPKCQSSAILEGDLGALEYKVTSALVR